MISEKPFAWATFDYEGSYDLRLYECNENYRLEYNLRNPNHKTAVTALYSEDDVVPRWKYIELVAHAKRLSDIIHNQRIKLDTVHFYQENEVWFWQGDGDDNLASLSCPIVITPEQLRQLLKENNS